MGPQLFYLVGTSVKKKIPSVNRSLLLKVVRASGCQRRSRDSHRQDPLTQRNLRDGRGGSVERSPKNPPLKIISLIFFEFNKTEFFFNSPCLAGTLVRLELLYPDAKQSQV